MATALIGVSGWQYPDFAERFYPEGMAKNEQLNYFASQFSTVEVNNTFYQLPSVRTVNNWRKTVPDDFTFAVKASRYITHMKNLLEPEETLPVFLERIALFGEQCGPILFQLPPQWGVNETRLKKFLGHLPDDHRYTFEFRNPTWFKESIYHRLQAKNMAFCVYDIDYRQSPIITTADFIYIRLHGPGQAYRDPYDLDAIGRWADRIQYWVNSGLDVYCYFDNTFRGYAWDNAKTLINLLPW